MVLRAVDTVVSLRATSCRVGSCLMAISGGSVPWSTFIFHRDSLHRMSLVTKSNLSDGDGTLVTNIKLHNLKTELYDEIVAGPKQVPRSEVTFLREGPFSLRSTKQISPGSSAPLLLYPKKWKETKRGRSVHV